MDNTRYQKYQTLNITRRGKDDAVLDIQMRADGPMLPNGSVIKIRRIVAGEEVVVHGGGSCARVWR